ncbi:hypothetical protein ACFQDE_02525 [Deinococcus caeni]|uniref:hypothetical protein n=1 Tax=Deinococcus caeni TaxID=569127 RepID=UPI00360B4D3D
MRGPYPAPRGPLRWVKLIVYAALLIAAQGLLSRLSDAAGIPAPDLFLLTGAALVWRLPPPGRCWPRTEWGWGRTCWAAGRWACTRRAWRAGRC